MHCQPLPCKPLSFMLLLSIGFGITTNINDWLKRCKFSCSLQHFSQQLAKNRNLTALSISVCLCHSHWQLLHSSLRKSLEEVNCIPDLIEGAMNIPCLRKLSIEVPLSPLLCVSLLINCQRAAHMCMTSSKRRNLLQTWEICSRKILLWKNYNWLVLPFQKVAIQINSGQIIPSQGQEFVEYLPAQLESFRCGIYAFRVVFLF